MLYPPIVLDYIMDSEVPKPCRHFIGRDKELEELYTMLEENRHVFLCGIAGIGKSELAKAYAKRYIKQYTNILYVEYTGNLHQDITDMDFIDDLPESTEQERFTLILLPWNWQQNFWKMESQLQTSY